MGEESRESRERMQEKGGVVTNKTIPAMRHTPDRPRFTVYPARN